MQRLEESLIAPLEKGLAYEIKTGCANARGKKFANFEQFLTKQLTLLSESELVKNSNKSSSIVLRMKEDGCLWKRMRLEKIESSKYKLIFVTAEEILWKPFFFC